jgi:transposase InsO family protein
VSSSSYYDRPKLLKERDELAILELRQAHIDHPWYGVARLAIHLGWSEEKTRRIRNAAGIVIPRASKKHKMGKSAQAEITAPANTLAAYVALRNPDRPQDGQSYAGMTSARAWVQDFTYLWFERSWHYLAAVLDLETRQVVGWKLGLSHSSELTYFALLDALSRHSTPTILHSDQGSEYLSSRHQILCEKLGITLSCSAPASPWQNGYMERWFGGFKSELGALTQFKSLAQLHEAIALQIHYYNTKRIHTALGMAPAAYAVRLKQDSIERELVSGKTGG